MLFEILKNAIPEDYREFFKISIDGMPSDTFDGPFQQSYLDQNEKPFLELRVEDRLALFNSIRPISEALDGQPVHIDFHTSWRWDIPFNAETRGDYHIVYVITLSPAAGAHPILWSAKSQVAQDFVALPHVTRADIGDLPLDLFGYAQELGMPHLFHSYSWTPAGLQVLCETKKQCEKVPHIFKNAHCSTGKKQGNDWQVDVTFPTLLDGLPSEYQVV